MKTITKVPAVMLLAIALLAACRPQEVKKPPDEVTVQLRWTHQAQFAGLYAADQKGYYAAEGLAVTFVEGGADVDLHKPVLDGTAQFGVAGAETLITARAEGKPLRAVATIYRRSPLVYMTLASSGITRPQDFAGKTIQVPAPAAVVFRTMMARAGIRPDQYTEVTLGADLTPFYTGKVHVWNAYITNQVLVARKAGYKLNIIYPDDYGVHFYADTIFTTDDLIARNPDLVRRFLRATLKGWTYAVENPNAIAPLVVKYKPDADVEHETAFMTASIPLVNTGEDYIGWMRAEVWQGMHDILLEQGILDEPMDVEKVYTMEFLQNIY